MYVRKLAAAAGFACGAALAFTPLASADSSDWWSSIDGLLSGASPAADTMSDFQISFNGMDLFPTTDNLATATTIEGQYGLAIAYGDGAKAIAEGGTGNYALASGNDAFAAAGSTATGATTSSYNIAEDIGNNVTPGATGAQDGAYAGGGSLIGGVDSSAAGSSHNAAYDIGNNGLNNAEGDFNGGNSGAFAGDGQLIGLSGSGNGDTAYTAGNLNGFGDGSASVDGNNNFASSSGAETGQNEGAFAGVGNNNTAIADTSYTHDGDGVSATAGNGNYAYVYGPDNSTASAGGTTTALGATETNLGNNNVAYVSDPYGNVNAPDSAVAGSSSTASGSNDIADVLYTHGDASAQGANNLYDIITPFGTSATPAAATAAAESAAATPITSTVDSEAASLNSQFEFDALLAGDSADITKAATPGTFDVVTAGDVTTVQGTGTTPFDYLVYGVDPVKAGLSGDPGSYDLYNGAEIRFDEAYNVASYALLNGGALDPNSADIFGAAIPAGDTTAAEVVAAFYNDAIGDLSGFFQANLSAFDTTPTAVSELFTLFGSL